MTGPAETEAPDSSAESRGSTRFGLVIRPAKLVCGRFEFPCVMRDVSESGISVRLFQPVLNYGPYAIEMLGGLSYPIELVWQKDLSAGFRFIGAVDIDKILANAGPYPNRPMRLTANMPAILEQNGRTSAVTVVNFSQQGARLLCPDHLAIGQLVALHSDWLPRVHAKVRWRKDQQYGVVFEQTFKLAELSDLAMRMQASASSATGGRQPPTKSSAA